MRIWTKVLHDDLKVEDLGDRPARVILEPKKREHFQHGKSRPLVFAEGMAAKHAWVRSDHHRFATESSDSKLPFLPVQAAYCHLCITCTDIAT